MNEASLTLKDARPVSADPFDLAALAAGREPERYGLHNRHLNEQMVRVLQTIGYDVGFTRGQGQYLWDRKGDRYLDLLSGWGVFALGRNHPDVSRALISVIEADLPNLVQMDVSVLVFGHIHRPVIEKGRRLLICPGSTTLPRLSAPSVAELVIEGGSVQGNIIPVGSPACNYLKFAGKLAEGSKKP